MPKNSLDVAVDLLRGLARNAVSIPSLAEAFNSLIASSDPASRELAQRIGIRPSVLHPEQFEFISARSSVPTAETAPRRPQRPSKRLLDMTTDELTAHFQQSPSSVLSGGN